MDAKQYQTVKALFLEAAELPEHAVDEFLAAQCDDEDTQNQVKDLLATYRSHQHQTSHYAEQLAANVIKTPLFFPDDRYTLLAELGQGGMGSVFLAQRKSAHIKQQVAIKILHLSDALSRQRFLQETQILSQLTHPNISQFVDADFLLDGRPYVVMEYINGQPITHFSQTVSVQEKLGLFTQLCQAVKHAHRHLIIHQDIKPDNVLVTQDQQVKLLDFGISKITDDAALLTKTKLRGLTPGYASPEQLLGKPITVSSDIYALGIVLYEMLTHRLPIDTDNLTPIEIQQKLSTTTIQKPSLATSTAENIDQDIDCITLKALEYEESNRYQSVDELLDDLSLYHSGLPIKAGDFGSAYRIKKFMRRHKISLLVGWVLCSITVAFVLTLLDKNQAIEIQLITIGKQRDDLLLEQKRAEYIAESITVERHADKTHNGRQPTVVNQMINVANGNVFYVHEIDLSDSPIELFLYYNSKSAQQTRGKLPFIQVGKGWSHSYMRQLFITRYANRQEMHMITADRADGEVIQFEKIDGQWTNSKGLDIEINKLDQGWTLINQQEIERYDWFGNLLEIESPEQKISLKWEPINPDTMTMVGRYKNHQRIESIHSDSGQHIAFHYQHDKTMVINAITDERNRTWTLEYDLFYNLTAIDNPDGMGKTFQYNKQDWPYNMTEVGAKLYDGFSFTHHYFDYHDINGKLTLLSFHSLFCEKNFIKVDYCCGATTLTNRQGQSNVYHLNNDNGHWTIRSAELGFDFPLCNFDSLSTWKSELQQLGQ